MILGTQGESAMWNIHEISCVECGRKSIGVGDTGKRKVTGGREEGGRKGKQGEEAWGREEVLLHT